MSVFPIQMVRKIIKELTDMYVPKYGTNHKMVEVERFEDKIIVDGIEVSINGVVKLVSYISASDLDQPACDAEVEIEATFIAEFRIGRERKPRMRKVMVYVSPFGTTIARTDDGHELDLEYHPRLGYVVWNVKEGVVEKVIKAILQYHIEKSHYYNDKYREIREKVKKILLRRWERYHKERWLRKYKKVFGE